MPQMVTLTITVMRAKSHSCLVNTRTWFQSLVSGIVPSELLPLHSFLSHGSPFVLGFRSHLPHASYRLIVPHVARQPLQTFRHRLSRFLV
jgi:hypothetical protein